MPPLEVEEELTCCWSTSCDFILAHALFAASLLSIELHSLVVHRHPDSGAGLVLLVSFSFFVTIGMWRLIHSCAAVERPPWLSYGGRGMPGGVCRLLLKVVVALALIVLWLLLTVPRIVAHKAGPCGKGVIMVSCLYMTAATYACCARNLVASESESESPSSTSTRGGGGGGQEATRDHRRQPELPVSIMEMQQQAAEEEDCAVCLSKLEQGDTVRRLVACHHVFHRECIDPWLREHRHSATCPLCRRALALLPPSERPAEVIVVSVLKRHQMNGYSTVLVYTVFP